RQSEGVLAVVFCARARHARTRAALCRGRAGAGDRPAHRDRSRAGRSHQPRRGDDRGRREELVAQATVPDTERLFREYHATLVRYLTRRLGDRDWAEEVAQETFVRALRQEAIVNERS